MQHPVNILVPCTADAWSVGQDEITGDARAAAEKTAAAADRRLVSFEFDKMIPPNELYATFALVDTRVDLARFIGVAEDI